MSTDIDRWNEKSNCRVHSSPGCTSFAQGLQHKPWHFLPGMHATRTPSGWNGSDITWGHICPYVYSSGVCFYISCYGPSSLLNLQRKRAENIFSLQFEAVCPLVCTPCHLKHVERDTCMHGMVASTSNCNFGLLSFFTKK